MDYIGLDVHSKYTKVQHMDAQGFLGFSPLIPTSAECLENFLNELDEPVSINMEAGRNWWWIYQLLKPHPMVAQVNVVDPRRMRNLAKELSVQRGYGRAKNDRIDAEMLAEAARKNLSPKIHIPTLQQLKQRSLVRYRMQMMAQKTLNSNELQAFLAFHGLHIRSEKLLEDYESQRPYLESLPEDFQFIIEGWVVESLRFFQKQIRRCDERLDKLLPKKHPQIQLLMSVPGVGIVLARIILTELLNIKRFEAPPYMISYIGLAPIEYDSAGRKGHIRLNPHCNYYLKYAFIAAAHAARFYSKFRRKYDHDVKKHGKIRAKINLARRLAKAVYWVLTRQQPFH